MKQVFQQPANGKLCLLDVPPPAVRAGALLVRNTYSAMSVGTERSMLEFGARSLLGKARARPDLARRVLQVARDEGPAEAYRQARGRLDALRPLGYSSAGVVVEVGEGVAGFAPGDRVACTGSGAAGHAELVVVPAGQAVRLPHAVDFEAGAFAALGAIAVHNVALAGVGAGAPIGVIGLGLLGLLAVQVATAAGCRVFAADPDPARVALARGLGCALAVRSDEPGAVDAARSALAGAAEAVLIFAATASNAPLELAAEIAGFRARIIAAGVVGLTIPRRAFYEKELSLRVARDWGAGAEARRNVETFVDLLDQRRVRVDGLITHRFPIDRAADAYTLLTGNAERPLGVVLTYAESARAPAVSPGAPPAIARPGGVGLSVIGAGTFARATILPIVRALPGVHLRGVAAAAGGTAAQAARKFGFQYATADVGRVLDDPDTTAVIIATRHNLHAPLVERALGAGKAVFVEKPLALSLEDLARVVAAHRRRPGLVMVGFNRRFAPATRATLEHLGGVGGPSVATCRVNVGAAAVDGWIHDPVEGGGRVLGEVCHFVDLLCALVDAEPLSVTAATAHGGASIRPDDNVAITLTWADGSVATLTYTALGDRAAGRERLEIFRGGSVATIEDFRTVTLVRGGRTRRRRGWRIDRGHRAQFAEFAAAVAAPRPLAVPFEAYVRSSLVTLAADRAARTGEIVDVPALRKTLETLCGS
jgi:2-desacetyl-2-hydroxyethyl bacteriochlorophyllide A dehydrogenase